jgi:hypothetical protein
MYLLEIVEKYTLQLGICYGKKYLMPLKILKRSYKKRQRKISKGSYN